MSKLSMRLWSNTNLTEHAKQSVYQAYVHITLFCGSDAWTTHTRQDKILNSSLFVISYATLHTLVGHCYKHRGLGMYSMHQRIHTIKPATFALVWSRPPNAWWPYTKSHVRLICYWDTFHCPMIAPLQRQLQGW